MQEARENFEVICEERKRFLTYMFMYRNPQSCEEMLEALKGHYQIVKLATVDSRLKVNPRSDGVFKILEGSNKNLAQLLKDLDSFVISKDDLRYELYYCFMEVMRDNIYLRLEINKQLRQQINDSEQRLHRHAMFQQAELNKDEDSYNS